MTPSWIYHTDNLSRVTNSFTTCGFLTVRIQCLVGDNLSVINGPAETSGSKKLQPKIFLAFKPPLFRLDYINRQPKRLLSRLGQGISYTVKPRLKSKVTWVSGKRLSCLTFIWGILGRSWSAVCGRKIRMRMRTSWGIIFGQTSTAIPGL